MSAIFKEAASLVENHFSSIPDNCFKKIEKDDLSDKRAPIANIIGWQTKIVVNNKWVDIMVTLTEHFPNKVPRIYLINPPYLIPHMSEDRNNHICIADHSSTFLNTSYPLKIVMESINIAANLIDSGLNEQNGNDFIKEFQSYWERDFVSEKWFSIVDPSSSVKKIKIIEFVPKLSNIELIAVDCENYESGWLNNIERKVNKKKNGKQSVKKISNGLYIHFEKPLSPPYPKDNFDIYQTFKKILKPSIFIEVNKYLFVNTDRLVRILFSFYSDADESKIILGALIIERTNFKGHKETIVDGFRNTKIPTNLQMSVAFPKKIIRRVNITRIDNQRLQQRIGNQKMTQLNNKTIVVIGCGSIGSRIAMNFALAGVENLILIDHDKLKVGNIARHICSMKDIGSQKVDAVSKHIKRRMPHVEINPISKNCIDILSDDQSSLLNSHLIISATGDKTFNVLLNELCFPLAILYSWIEINGYASHSFLYNPGLGGCFNCLLDEHKNDINNCVVSPPELILQQEAGCNSIFLPFSAIASNNAAGFSTHLGLSFLNSEIPVSEKWTFYGDLNDALNKGLSLSVTSEKSFTLAKDKVYRKLNCNNCKRK